mmetsp:Transcript_2869/g.5998  ORF Transcript_2869/g.5998 Transcript_2869/m.5998 type:complete len:213 (-) Transcript_2869:883-1521(-)
MAASLSSRATVSTSSTRLSRGARSRLARRWTSCGHSTLASTRCVSRPRASSSLRTSRRRARSSRPSRPTPSTAARCWACARAKLPSSSIGPSAGWCAGSTSSPRRSSGPRAASSSASPARSPSFCSDTSATPSPSPSTPMRPLARKGWTMLSIWCTKLPSRSALASGWATASSTPTSPAGSTTPSAARSSLCSISTGHCTSWATCPRRTACT